MLSDKNRLLACWDYETDAIEKSCFNDNFPNACFGKCVLNHVEHRSVLLEEVAMSIS